MRSPVLFFTLLALSACQSLQSNDPSSMFFTIPAGSTLTLNKALEISTENTHVRIQSGKAITEKEKNEYDINCRLDFKNFGPRTVEPETYIISHTEDGSEWFSQPTIKRFYTEVYLSSERDTDIIKLECQVWGNAIDRNFTVTEMQQALGDELTFNFYSGTAKK